MYNGWVLANESYKEVEQYVWFKLRWLGIPIWIVNDDSYSEVKIKQWLFSDSNSNEDVNFWIKLTYFLLQLTNFDLFSIKFDLFFYVFAIKISKIGCFQLNSIQNRQNISKNWWNWPIFNYFWVNGLISDLFWTFFIIATIWIPTMNLDQIYWLKSDSITI